jgi:hypothetical protein
VQVEENVLIYIYIYLNEYLRHWLASTSTQTNGEVSIEIVDMNGICCVAPNPKPDCVIFHLQFIVESTIQVQKLNRFTVRDYFSRRHYVLSDAAN